MSKGPKLAVPCLIGLLSVTFAIGISAPLPLAAQSMTNSFGGLSESSNEPIDIESDVLVVQDKQKVATFKGNVKAVQGTTMLRARELNVHYVGGDGISSGVKKAETESPAAAAPGDAGESGKPAGQDARITKIEAKGDVIITSKDDQTTTSDWALYDLPAQLVTVGGNVVLTQGKNVLKGDRLVIDLKTGESRFEHTGNATAGGRIRALFMPKQSGKDAKPDGTTTEPAPAAAKKSKPSGDGADNSATPIGPPDVPWPTLDKMH